MSGFQADRVPERNGPFLGVRKSHKPMISNTYSGQHSGDRSETADFGAFVRKSFGRTFGQIHPNARSIIGLFSYAYAKSLPEHKTPVFLKIVVAFVRGRSLRAPPNRTTRTLGEQMSDLPEAALWRAVILQAFKDATAERPKQSLSEQEIEAARRWFDDGRQSFRVVCTLANLEPDHLHRVWRSRTTQ